MDLHSYFEDLEYRDIELQPIHQNESFTIYGYRDKKAPGWRGKRRIPEGDKYEYLRKSWDGGMFPAHDVYWPDSCYKLVTHVKLVEE